VGEISRVGMMMIGVTSEPIIGNDDRLDAFRESTALLTPNPLIKTMVILGEIGGVQKR
jgi:hypothetical protein